jgi:hypothetical protein
MPKESSTVRLNIYLPDQATRRRIKLRAAEQNLTLSQFCLQAVQAQLPPEDRQKRPSLLTQAVDRARKFQRQAFGGRVFQVNSADLIRRARREGN